MTTSMRAPSGAFNNTRPPASVRISVIWAWDRVSISAVLTGSMKIREHAPKSK
jgi:hypothetical protein